ncbi:MAG TPA: methionine synthase [Candidatus Dormibacteraeota bacterium]|nr:methionine synthase [Candidatus Dormibacteraeota bacterium]
MSFQYRADHVGSLLRPADLLAARANGTNASRLRAMEDEYILKVLGKQKELGFEIFTDGELRRRNFMSELTDAVDGFDLDDSIARDWDVAQGKNKVASVTGVVNRKLKRMHPLTERELPFLKLHSPGDIKILLPSPTQFPAIAFKRGVTDKVYRDHSALLWDIVEIMKQDVAQLAAEGVKYIQMDAPRYSYYLDPKWRAWIKQETNQDAEEALDEAIAADNACLDAARRAGATVAIHLCRGNNRSHWYAEGGYDAIAEKLFNSLRVDRFLLEYDDERAGTFEPLRLVPKDKVVVLGLITSKKPQLEKSEDVVRRIREAGKYFPLESMAVSPQCGFASTAEGNLLSEDDQWAKLKLVVNTARRVWH